MMMAGPAPYQTPYQCQCGALDPTQCVCGVMSGMQPAHHNPRLPYHPSMPIPADAYSCDQQVPTTSGMMPNVPMHHPGTPQHHNQQQQQHGMYPGGPGSVGYMQQQNSPCHPSTPHPPAPTSSSAYNTSRPPSRIHQGTGHSAHTAQWMNSHYMNPSTYANSPGASANPSIMSVQMSHMSVQDDHLSMMSLHSMPGAQQPQYAELRPCSQTSTISCAENIDPRQPIQPVQLEEKWTLPELLQVYLDPNYRVKVIKESYRMALQMKEKKMERDVRLLEAAVKLTRQMIGQLEQGMGQDGPIRECITHLLKAMYYLIRYLSAKEVFEVNRRSNGDLVRILVFMVREKAALLALVHILEWKESDGRESPQAVLIKKSLKEKDRDLELRLLETFMEMLLQTSNLSSFQSYQYVLDGLRELAAKDDDVKDYVLSRWSQCSSLGGIIQILCRCTFPFCEEIKNMVKSQDADVRTVLYKTIQLLWTVAHKARIWNPLVLQKMVESNTIPILCRYLSSSQGALTTGLDILMRFDLGIPSPIDTMDVQSVRYVIDQVITEMRKCHSGNLWTQSDAVKWMRAMGFLSNFIANREFNKATLIECHGFGTVATALFHFSNKFSRDSDPRSRFTLNEFADNAMLCLTGMLTMKEMNGEYARARDTALDQRLLVGILNYMCQGELYVKRRAMRLLSLLIDWVPAFRSDDYLQKVFDEQRKQNLIGTLYDCIATAMEKSRLLNQNPARNEERLRIHADLTYRAFNLLNQIMKYCGSRPMDDIRFLVRNNPSPPMELLNAACNQQNTAMCAAILHFCDKVIDSSDSLPIQQAWSNERQMVELLANSSDPNVVQPAQSLVRFLAPSTDLDSLAGVFSAMGSAMGNDEYSHFNM